MTPSDTIVAVATPHGFGGISVVRISGPDSKNIVKKISLENKKKGVFKHRAVTLVNIIDNDGRAFEEGVVTFFKKPLSYTGEDTIEVSCHGNPSVVNRIISLCCTSGARPADPGEFTKRAFLNGKMDLVQAEAVASLIHAKTEEGALLNFKMLRGELSKKMNTIKNELKALLVMLEFEIDVSEELLQPNLTPDSLSSLKAIQATIKSALESHNSVRMLNDGASVVICGAPNAGKSTLLNCLSGVDRAITGPEAGTTRDTIRASISLGGTPVTLIDTAGLRVSKNKIEKEGVSRAKKEINTSDCVIVLTPADEPIKKKYLKISSGPTVHVITKADLCTKKEISYFKNKFPDACIISAKTSFGVPDLLGAIQAHMGLFSSLSSLVPVTTGRQNSILKKINCCIQKSIDMISFKGNPPLDLVSFELRDALEQIDAVLGKTSTDEILDSVFSSFCVGK